MTVCPLGKEYPVAVMMESPVGRTLASLIQGRGAQTVSFTRELIAFPALYANNVYRPVCLSMHQYTKAGMIRR